MKIALLTDGIYPYVMGGMQKHSYYLAKYLVKHQVEVVLYHTGPSEANTKDLAGFTKDDLTLIHPVYIPFPSLGSFPGHYLLESYHYSKLIHRELARRENVDLIYCQGLTGWKTILEKNLPTNVINLHGLNMYQYNASIKAKLEAFMLRMATDSLIKKSNYVISLGGKLTKTLTDAGVNKSRIIEQPVGVESKWLNNSFVSNNINHKSRRFVFVGRYDKVKGIELLSEVLTGLSGVNFEFYFIGPIPEDKQLEQNNVQYLGLLKDEQDIIRILREADVLVCPSYSEGMPTVILEAMASGLAIIATDVGAVNTMVSEKNGWLIPAADKYALKKALLEAIHLNNKELMLKKEASLSLVKNNFVWDIIISSTIRTINTLINSFSKINN